MSVRDVERWLLSAISSPEERQEALERLTTFVSQRPAEVAQLETWLLGQYNSNSLVTPLEFFVEILFAIRDHLNSESISRTWWDLVLRPALRREQLSRKARHEAIQMVMIGLKEGGTGFRRRLLQLSVLGVPSHDSVEDAIETAHMNTDERAQMSQWRDSLVEILTNDAISNPQAFFEEMQTEFRTPDNRLSLSILLSKLAASDDFPVTTFGESPLLMTLLISLFIDNSATVFNTQLTTLVILLPLFAVKAPKRLHEILPELLAILARAICWQSRTGENDDLVGVLHQRLEIREEYEWKRLEFSFDAVPSITPDATRYFTFLYGIYPCNCLAFLREPVQYLIDKDCKSPFTVNWDEALDEEEIWNRCDTLVRQHIFHPALIKQTAGGELEQTGTWTGEVADVVRACSLLDVRNVASTWENALRDRLQPNHDVWMEGEAISEPGDGNATPVDHPRLREPSKRPHVSLRQLMDMHMILRSGQPIDIINDFPDLPSTPRTHPAPLNPAYEVAAALGGSYARHGAQSPEVASLSSTQREEAKEEAISTLQRDLLMMMNELNFETYLRRHYLAQIGYLNRKSAQIRSSEMERQRMRDQIKRNEQEIERHKREKRDMQIQIDRYREGGDNYSVNMSRQINRMKQEKQAWLAEAQDLRARDAENKDVLAAQSERLADIEKKNSDLLNERKENEVKVALIQDYERQIEILRKAEEVWRIDHRKLKWQEDVIEQIRSKAYNMQAIIDSEQYSNAQLTNDNRALEERVYELEVQLDHMRRAPPQNPRLVEHTEALQRNFYERIRELEDENAHLRSRNAQAERELLQERVKRETLERREHQRSRAQAAPEDTAESS
ncbi:SubName: Full=Uncharacterized protein {ECO:0000313/EMBL:CCA69400.1} [Serendipita indica DSM 11827]|nr:SubName: Full=Uncharacterized protein {ECO:0000313/EMBL:CCA69400.1} [Serendipita indica DSM 11827]